MTDQSKIAALLAIMAETYGRALTPAALEMMADDLSGLTYEQVRAAAQAHRRGPRGAFFPQPGELLAWVGGTAEAAATTALATLQGAIRDIGSYQTPVFEDPLLVRAIQALGGWSEVCQMGPEMLIPHFRRCYEAAHRAGGVSPLPEPRLRLPDGTAKPLGQARALGCILGGLLPGKREAAA